MLEAVYSSHAGRRVPTIETASTEKEARRVLAWQEEVARSTAASEAHSCAHGSDIYADRRPPPPPSYRRAETFPRIGDPGMPMRLLRRETVTTEHYRDERERAAMEDRGRGGAGAVGSTGMKLMGTLLGAAAGAAVAYAMVCSELPPRLAPPPRRASYGDNGLQYTHARPVERMPPHSYVSSRDAPAPKYAEYRITPPPAPSRAKADAIAARLEERSHVSSDSERISSRTRSRSEVRSSRYDRPLAILPPRARSPPASHASRHTHHSRLHGSEKDSYVSARTSGTGTVKPVTYISASSSKITTTTIRVLPPGDEERRSEISYARRVPLPVSEVSARHVPLPRSMVSEREYAESVAPSDSVSSVGSKRERERLRERMGRGGW